MNINVYLCMENKEEKLNIFYQKYLRKVFPVVKDVIVTYKDFGDGTYTTKMGIKTTNDDALLYGDKIKEAVRDTEVYMGLRFPNIYFYS
jgi:hypothetical protein